MSKRITPYGAWLTSADGIDRLFELKERGEDTYQWWNELKINQWPERSNKERAWKE